MGTEMFYSSLKRAKFIRLWVPKSAGASFGRILVEAIVVYKHKPGMDSDDDCEFDEKQDRYSDMVKKTTLHTYIHTYIHT
jgi:hypothetical protein